eukprot:gene39470-48774_t
MKPARCRAWWAYATLSRMTIVTTGSDDIIEQITKHLNRLIEVVKVVDLTEGQHIERELMLIKVRAVGKEREEMKRTADIFRGRIIDVTEKTYTIELTGAKSKLAAQGLGATLGDDMVKAYRAAMDAGKHTVDPVLTNFKSKYAVDWSPFLGKKWTDAGDTAQAARARGVNTWAASSTAPPRCASTWVRRVTRTGTSGCSGSHFKPTINRPDWGTGNSRYSLSTTPTGPSSTAR